MISFPVLRALVLLAIAVASFGGCSSYGETAPPASVDGGGPDATTTPGSATCPARGPVSDGLLAWYPFDEGSGTVATDCSGNGLHGTSAGTSPKWVDARTPAAARAVDLDGESCFVLGSATALAFTEKSRFTVSAWLKPREWADPGDDARIVIGRRTRNPLTGWHFATDDPNVVELDMESDANPNFEVEHTVPKDVWIHAAAVYDGTLKVYVNGTLVNSAEGPPVLVADPNAIGRIGCSEPGRKGYVGLVDDLRVYGRVLSDAEITALAQP